MPWERRRLRLHVPKRQRAKARVPRGKTNKGDAHVTERRIAGEDAAFPAKPEVFTTFTARTLSEGRIARAICQGTLKILGDMP